MSTWIGKFLSALRFIFKLQKFSLESCIIAFLLGLENQLCTVVATYFENGTKNGLIDNPSWSFLLFKFQRGSLKLY